eukprot:TRINITY_DN6475_c0_g1_i1.p1 TRINITY_DN6475_c0_g1~~TRINITY_DN6475_c0_g1_i1.p1  ORF type:complete len:523 (+),score=81.24 TRINITY_DN6475_c0_g1_i1:74-1642(+)
MTFHDLNLRSCSRCLWLLRRWCQLGAVLVCYSLAQEPAPGLGAQEDGSGHPSNHTERYCPEYDSLFTESATPQNDICTTTTTVTTTTTGTTSTSTTTTTPFVQQRCEELCVANSHPWFVKCVWDICATCLECTNVIKPPPPTPPPPPPRTFPSTTTVTTSTTSTTSTSSTSSTSTTSKFVSTTEEVEEGSTARPGCQDGCRRAAAAGESWRLMCQWALCWTCEECDPTTTTATNTTTTTSTTSSGTTMTTTAPPEPPSTTTENYTSTTTTATSTTTTTTNGACAPLATSFPARGCHDAMSPNTTCETRTIDHACVEQSKLVFHCPLDNVDPNRQPDLVMGTFRTKCKVCGLEPSHFIDEDPRKRIVNMSFEFGPNSLEGIVDQSDIEEYHIYFADLCGNLLKVDSDNASHTGEIVTLPVDNTLEAGCCTRGAYKVGPLKTRMPGDEANLTVMVIPKIAGVGLLSVGSIAGYVTDFHDREAEAFWGLKRASATVRQAEPTKLAAWAVWCALTAVVIVVTSSHV